MAKKKSEELQAIERLCVQQEMTNRLLSLFMMRHYSPLFSPAVVATALSETQATPVEIARIVPGITARTISTLKCANKKYNRKAEATDEENSKAGTEG